MPLERLVEAGLPDRELVALGHGVLGPREEELAHHPVGPLPCLSHVPDLLALPLVLGVHLPLVRLLLQGRRRVRVPFLQRLPRPLWRLVPAPEVAPVLWAALRVAAHRAVETLPLAPAA